MLDPLRDDPRFEALAEKIGSGARVRQGIDDFKVNEFLQRLKQRKLVQWTLAYVAAAFALLQGIDIVAQRFGWPEQTMRFVIIALSVGFFVTLVLAWYHGERGAQRVSGTELIILALLVSLGGFLLWRFAAGMRPPAIASFNSTSPVAIPGKIDCGAAVRKPERRQGQRLFRGRNSGRNPDAFCRRSPR